jgi:hypothetical protein
MLKVIISLKIMLLMKLDMIIKINPKCYHKSIYIILSQILEHIFGGYSAKFICICGISFYIYRLSKTGSKVKGMEKYTKNQNIHSCSGEHIYILEYIYIYISL